MKTNLIVIAHTGRLRAAFRHGKSLAGNIHVRTPRRELLRIATRHLILDGKDRRVNMARSLRDDRRAMYAGLFSGLRNERRMMAAFNL